jgi:integrase
MANAHWASSFVASRSNAEASSRSLSNTATDTSNPLAFWPGPPRRHRPSIAATDCSWYAASRWPCASRTPVIRFPKQKRSGVSRPSAARRISMHPMRSRACLRLPRHSSPPAPSGRSYTPRSSALIAATGLRIAEALVLHVDDVTADGLAIRETKFQKSRLLPLHETVQQALDKYMIARRGVLGDSVPFVSGAGRPLPCNISPSRRRDKSAIGLSLRRALGD